MSGLSKCEEVCSGRCLEALAPEFFDCVNECMRTCLANVAGEAS